MNTFVIDSENNITLIGTGEQAPETVGSEKFKSSAEMANLAESWPSERLVEIWNSLPGVVPVKKFTSRKIAVTRIWRAIQSLGGGAAPQTSDVAPRGAASGKKRYLCQQARCSQEVGQSWRAGAATQVRRYGAGREQDRQGIGNAPAVERRLIEGTHESD